MDFQCERKNLGRIIVTGGTFNDNIVDSEYIAHGYFLETRLIGEKALRDNGDGTWTVVDAVVQRGEGDSYSGHWNTINQYGYLTLQDAINDVDDPLPDSDPQIIQLLKDNEISETLDIAHTFELDLNGFKLNGTGPADKPVLKIQQGKQLHVVNGQMDVKFTPSKVGYSFEKWMLASENGEAFDFPSNGIITGNEPFELYAAFSPNVYTITWMNGDSKFYQHEQTFDEVLSLPEGKPTQNNGVFLGWYTAPEGGERIADGNLYQMPSDVIYYAHYQVTTKDALPTTGDKTPLLLYVLLTSVALAGFVFTRRRVKA